MRTLVAGGKATIARLADRITRADARVESPRFLRALVRAAPGNSAALVAQRTGGSTTAVPALRLRRSREGDAVFDVRGRGGAASRPGFVRRVMDQTGWHPTGEMVVPPNLRLPIRPACSPELHAVEHRHRRPGRT